MHREGLEIKGGTSLGSIRLDHHDHLQDGALNRLVNLYRGRGGRPELEGASLNGWPVWRVGILLSGLFCNRSARKGIVARSRSVDEYSIVALFLTYNALL